MDAETRAAHAAHARHVATGEGVPFRGVDHAAPGSTDYSAVVEGFKSPDGTLTITRSELIPAPEPVPTGEYCGFCDCGIFSDGSGHHSAQCVDTEAGTKPNPFARKPEPVPAPTVDAGPVEERETCPHCGSANLEWFIAHSTRSDAPDGRLRMSEISTTAALGCGECSETVRVLSEGRILDRLRGLPMRRALDVPAIMERTSNEFRALLEPKP